MSTKYSNIANKLRKAFDSSDRALFDGTLKLLHDQFLSYHAAIEVVGKESKPLSERYLEIIYVESSSSKITVNANTGRVTLKISNKATDNVIKHYHLLVDKLLITELPPITLRGKIEYKENGYQCQLISESGKIKHFIRVEEE